MNSLRLFSRALPKASLRQSAIQYSSSVSRFTARRATWQPAMRTSYPAFSTSTICREPAGDSDLELAEKLNSERQLELENNDESTVAAIDDFLKTHPWEVQDKPGTHEVTLTREFGNEKIKVALSVAEIDNMPEEDEFGGLDEDGALEDEADYGSNKATINQSGTRGGKVDVMPEDSIAPADREGEDPAGMAGETPAYPIHLTITITKPGKKALEVRAIAQEGTIEIDTISFFPKESLLEAQTPKDAQEARNLYAGPAIGNLDPDLQAMLEKYLEERGIDAELAGFLFEYVDYKEQREYVKWLDDVKAFVEE